MHFQILDINRVNRIQQWQNCVKCHLQGVQIEVKIFFFFFSWNKCLCRPKKDAT